MAFTDTIQCDFEYGDSFFITTMPPYFCQNPPTSGKDWSAGQYGMWGVGSNLATPAITRSTGLKIGWSGLVAYNDPNPSPSVAFQNYSGTPGSYVNIINFDKNNWVGNPEKALQNDGGNDGWAVGDNKDSLGFGPYRIGLTPFTTGKTGGSGADVFEVLYITTGSDVLIGEIKDGGTAYSKDDSRMFNILCYATGGKDGGGNYHSIALGERLTGITFDGTVGTQLTLLDQGWYAFVALEHSLSPGSYFWWPIPWIDGKAGVAQGFTYNS